MRKMGNTNSAGGAVAFDGTGELDRSFQERLKDIGDMIRREMDTCRVQNRILTVMICPSGRAVSCWEMDSSLYDFYWENIPSYRGWRDLTEHQNSLRVKIDADAISLLDPEEARKSNRDEDGQLEAEEPGTFLTDDPMEDDGK